MHKIVFYLALSLKVANTFAFKTYYSNLPDNSLENLHNKRIQNIPPSNLATIQVKDSLIVKSDFEQISEILNDYIEGTRDGQPERLRKAFHPNFNLYTVSKDTLWTRSGEHYISSIKDGEKTNRIGRIISIDIEKDAAIAKAEIEISGWRTFTDYFLILKFQGAWKIVHKSYTWRELESKK